MDAVQIKHVTKDYPLGKTVVQALRGVDLVIKNGLNLNQFVLQILEYLRHLLIDRITKKDPEVCSKRR